MAYSTPGMVRLALAPFLDAATADNPPTAKTNTAADLTNDQLVDMVAEADAIIDGYIAVYYATPVGLVGSAPIPAPDPIDLTTSANVQASAYGVGVDATTFGWSIYVVSPIESLVPGPYEVDLTIPSNPVGTLIFSQDQIDAYNSTPGTQIVAVTTASVGEVDLLRNTDTGWRLHVAITAPPTTLSDTWGPGYGSVTILQDAQPGSLIAPHPIDYWSRNVAAYNATLTYRRGKDMTDDDPVYRRYQATLAALQAVAKGSMSLPLPGNVSGSGAGAGNVVNPYAGNLFGIEDFTIIPQEPSWPYAPPLDGTWQRGWR